MDTIDKSLWAPVIDGVELLGSPADRLAQGKVANVPMLFVRHVTAFFTPCHIAACHAMPHNVIAMPRHDMSHHVMPCYAMSSHATSVRHPALRHVTLPTLQVLGMLAG
jgi:hypothetical protein